MHEFKFKVVQNDGLWEASAPYRQTVYQGSTAKEATSNLFRSYAELQEQGHIDLENPQAPGA
jgi:hypothetical protein